MRSSGGGRDGSGRAGRPSLIASGLTGRWVTTGPGNPLRWFFVAVWLIYLVQPVAGLYGHGHPMAWPVGGTVLAVVFSVIYVAAIGTWHRHPRWARAGLGALVLLTAVACLVYGAPWTALWIYVSAATGFVFPGRRGTVLAVIAVTGCYLLTAWLTGVGAANFATVALPVMLVGWAMAGLRMQTTLVRELRQAREAVATLAASEERLRVARDMHDLTGQSLSMITLKSDLAGKVLGRLPASPERDAALSELGDIGRVSRQTLHDIREAISGYRRPTLAVETITARTALEAAGIQCDEAAGLMLRSGALPPDAEAALAWCLREAVTNVIRHSGARLCHIALTERGGEVSLDVRDDGRGLAGTPPQGTGMRGMSERLAAVGGRLSVGTAGPHDHGARLTATVPATPAGPGPEPGTENEAVPAGPVPEGPVPAGPVPGARVTA